MDRFRSTMSRGIPLPGDAAGNKDRLTSTPSYISQMLQSNAKARGLTIYCWHHPDRHLVSVICPKGIPHLLVLVKCVQVVRETTIRGLFTQAGISPVQDELTGNNGDESRFLLYPLPAVVNHASSLLQQLLRRAYQIDEEMDLEIAYSERDAA